MGFEQTTELVCGNADAVTAVYLGGYVAVEITGNLSQTLAVLTRPVPLKNILFKFYQNKNRNKSRIK